MPNYDWTCSICSSPNQAGSDICTACNSPAEISGLEVESLQSGVSSVSEYLCARFRTYIKNPYAKDMFKTTILFGLMFGLAGLSIWLEITVLVWVTAVFSVYVMIFFVRVWWRVVKHLLFGKPYERV